MSQSIARASFIVIVPSNEKLRFCDVYVIQSIEEFHNLFLKAHEPQTKNISIYRNRNVSEHHCYMMECMPMIYFQLYKTLCRTGHLVAIKQYKRTDIINF